MKTIFFRTSRILIALGLGSLLFLLLSYAGSKSKGPLDEMALLLNKNVARFEKNIVETRASRSESLRWFDKYRQVKRKLNDGDVFLLGAYDDHTVESYENIISLEDSINTKFSMISLYTAWGSKKNEVFPTLRAQAIADLGSIPVITWEPWIDDFDPQLFSVPADPATRNMYGMRGIAEGRYDAYIDKWAADAKSFSSPFFLRFGHEMNDPYRYPWGPQNNSPQDYVSAWKHVRERFQRAGAINAIWVWSPHPAYSYSEYYPGDDNVDWIGTTTINYGAVATWSQWWSFDDIFGKFYNDVMTHKKPIILTEFGSLGVGGDRAQWFKSALDAMPVKYPLVRGAIFFHVSNDATTTYKSLDWSFINDDRVIAALKSSVNDLERREGLDNAH